MSGNEAMTVKEIFEANDTAKAVRDDLSKRERLRHETDVTRYRTKLVREGNKIDVNQYSGFWKALDKAGVGSLIIGRRGRPTRFVWNYNLKDVAKAGATGQPVSEMTPLEENKKSQNKSLKRGKKSGRKPKNTDAAPRIVKDPVEGFSLNVTLSPKITNSTLTALLDLIREVNEKAS